MTLDELKRPPKVPEVETPPLDLGYMEFPNGTFDEKDDSGGNWMRHEGFKDKFIRKTKENPFVPIGKIMQLSRVFFDAILLR